MKMKVKSVHLRDTVYIEGLGAMNTHIPAAGKPIPEMWYDPDLPTLLFISHQNKTHFIPLDNLRSGNFVLESQQSVEKQVKAK